MRLFVAAELPEEIREALAETSALLRGCVRGRYVAPNSFHVTLAFLGEVEPHCVNGVCNALERGCAGHTAFPISLGDFGCFGKRSKATLWQGFSNATALTKLAETVRAELRAEGFRFDEKPFIGHVTLMRSADITTGKLPAPAFAEGTIERIALFSSDLSGPHPVYTPLHAVELSLH